jgi:tRNA uridine 5-carboxymethylaminomethyl modification enzyme
MDRDIYKQNMGKALLESSFKDKLNLVEGSVHDLLVEDGKCVGISLADGTELRSKSVVITTGTFLGG